MSAIDQIKKDEGFRGKPYKCTANKTTIGYGRNLDDKPLTEEEAEYLLNNDLKEITFRLAQFSFYSKISPDRRAVLINMAYNLGIAGFCKFKNMINALIQGDFELAANEMLNSKWAVQVGLRAERLAKQMRGD